MKTVIVLGNARSGTSMTAGVLFYLGVNIDHVHKTNSQNPKGAFESDEWNILTTEIYQAQNKEVYKDQIEDQIKKLVEKQSSGLCGWKSAMTHWSLDMFLPFIENPYLVIVTRNIVDNARSWKTHMKTNYGRNVSLEQALENMAESTRVLIKNVNAAQCPKLWTTYEGLKRDPIFEAKRMANFLDIEFNKNKQDQIQDFIMFDYTTIKE